jgi:hypothetical protein
MSEQRTAEIKLLDGSWVEVPVVKPGESIPGRWLHLELAPEREGDSWRWTAKRKEG